MTSERRPLRKEFYVFWNSGLTEGGYVDGSAVVCALIMDKGETTVTRIFSSGADDMVLADEHLIEWLTEHPLVLEAEDIEMRIHLNYSPQYATAQALVNLVTSLQRQCKEIQVTMKFVQLYKTENDEDADENRRGLRTLRQSGFKLDVFDEADWFYLAETLADKSSRKTQSKNAVKAKKKLKEIFTDTRDAGSVTECVKTSETNTMTDVFCDADQSSSDSQS
ncbi:uncharacterized protein LOC121386316 [Gigantopelta aegis]|uniref:uncharacterized protein LOC121386316 n=1 Tax=Gigantopelta aegis TaxID=1735272 RepID=UPI001B889BE0|nr:uncharacterized protein LOC121386316 [Gigantopelta aegis]